MAMYYPILRGRQNELLALEELLNRNKLSKKIVPVIEPVKLSPTLVRVFEIFDQKQRNLIWIRNPGVGAFNSDWQNSKNKKYVERLQQIVDEDHGFIQRGLYIDKSTPAHVAHYQKNGVNLNKITVLCLKPDLLKIFSDSFADYDTTVMVPYARSFKRIDNPKILTDDNFNKLIRNSDYTNNDDEFFSDDHLYRDEEYVGFSDYSIIGEEYSEAGFAPYAVAIHIVYFDADYNLRVHHFVSDTNDDITDPAGKFYEALTKLYKWNQQYKLNTWAMQQFESIYREQSYPGLGVVKRLSVMHHLELMGMYLDGDLA